MGRIPKAVQEQEKRAEDAIAAVEELRSAETAEHAAETSSSQRDDLLGEGLQPPKVEKPEGTGKEGADSETQAKLAKLEHAMSVLQGKYNAEVPQYAERIRELERENDELREKAARADELREQISLDPESARKYLTEEELEDVGAEALEFQARVTRGVAENVVEAHTHHLEAKIEELERKLAAVGHEQEATRAIQFWDQVDALAPGAKTANESEDPQWLAFLGEKDPVSRLTYREIGVTAVARGDAEAVANLYKLFLDRSGKAGKRRVSEEAAAQVTPRQTRPATNPGQGRQPTARRITENEIRKAYRDAALGHISPDQLAVMEAEFDRAASEGLVVLAG